jgi:hypothetical protein
MLALNKNLLEEFFRIFIKKEQFQVNKKIVNLIKYIQLPVRISTHQYPKINNPQLAKQYGSFFRPTKKDNDEELVKSTVLKLMLVDNNIKKTNFVTVNVISDEIDVRYSATYKSGQKRDKAIKHIKDLLQDATYIEIIDRYFTAINNWEDNITIIREILPLNEINLKIVANPQISGAQKNELKQICNKWKIKGGKYNPKRQHDRYIITDNLKILLSSGIYNLSENNKDFTYIILLKR